MMGEIVSISDFATAQMLETCLEFWKYYIGRPAAPYERDRLRYWLEFRKLSDGDIQYALEETAAAPRPSARYFDSICLRLWKEKEEEAWLKTTSTKLESET